MPALSPRVYRGSAAGARSRRVREFIAFDDPFGNRLELVTGQVTVARPVAMFPAPRQRWVDDLALSGAELASIRAPVLMVHGRDDRVVPWRTSSAPLLDLLPDGRLHVMSNCGHWTMIEKTGEFLAVVQPFLAS